MSYSTMTTNLARVANGFLKKAEEAGLPMTPMKLIKLCYIAQGFSLATYGKSIFDDEIEAWRYGPVIPALYKDIKEFGNNPINRYCSPIKNAVHPQDVDSEKLLEQEKETIDSVWQQLSNWSAMELSTWTHRKGSAWDEVTENGKIICNMPINQDLIKKEFLALQSPN